MRHLPGLDGLRAVAVVAVVLFHAESPLAPGGFLGVSLFFTLSGFLITALLITEHGSTGTISLRSFYGRRARRLLPAAYLCVILVGLCGWLWSGPQRRALPGDTIAAVANVANWRFAFAPTGYEEIFTTDPSPLAHFWSLAIEEQLYLVLPLFVVLALGRGRRTLAIGTGVLIAASVAATLLTNDHNLVYNGTHTRAAELLIGAALAQWWVRAPAGAGHRLAWLPGALASAAFVGLVAGASIDQEWIYTGSLPAVAVVSAVLVGAVARNQFPVRLLTSRPLVVVGTVSYGIYLFHWPVFLLLDPARTGLDGPALAALRLTVTAALTAASYLVVEQPIRRRRWLPSARVLVPAMALGATLGIAVSAVVVPPATLTASEELLEMGDRDVVEFAPSGGGASADPVDRPRTPVERTRPEDAPPAREVESTTARVLVTGSDRAAFDALERAGLDVVDGIRDGCPLSSPSNAACVPLAVHVAALVDAERPDIVVITSGITEHYGALAQRESAATDDELNALGVLQERAVAEAVEAIDVSAESGAQVVWYTAAQTISAYYRQFQRIAVSHDALVTVHGPVHELVDHVVEHAASAAAVGSEPTVLRVLVVGDSTSLYLAQALSDGSDGRLHVLWAGANGCPIEPLEATRGGPGAPWLRVECTPYDEKIPGLQASFDPDVLLVMTGPTDLNEHRYGDGTVAHAGQPAFAAARDAAVERLLAAVGDDLPVLVADIPAPLDGRFTSEPMMSPQRLDAVNSQIAAWAERWPQLAVFAYRSTLEEAEVRAGRVLRADGVHPDVVPLEAMARAVFVDALIAQVAAVRAEIAAAAGTA